LARLEDVARAAGVSRGTVSNVFNKPELVRAELRARVLTAAHSLGFSGPDPAARLLRGGRVNAIGFMMGGDGALFQLFTNPYGRDLMAGIGAECDLHGAGVAIIADIGDDKVWGIRNAIVDGFILQRIEELAHLDTARSRNLPFVVLDYEAPPDVSTVCIDDRAGARMAAEHLLALGHRRFAIMSILRTDPAVIRRRGVAPAYHPPGRTGLTLVQPDPVDHLRIAGYADALATAGIDIVDIPIVESITHGVAEARPGAALLLDQAPEATALLCMSDVLALAVLEEAKARDIDVARQVSVVGFDDNPEAARAIPPLTTIAQPVIDKGRAAARIIFEFKDKGPQQIMLPLSLRVRASTAPPHP
jgi:DNA-binding LacI/PurR family transcriptional regulator